MKSSEMAARPKNIFAVRKPALDGLKTHSKNLVTKCHESVVVAYLSKNGTLEMWGEEKSCLEVEKFRDQLENIMLSNQQNGSKLKFVSTLSPVYAKSEGCPSSQESNKVRLRKLPNILSNNEFWTFLATRKLVSDMLSSYALDQEVVQTSKSMDRLSTRYFI